jgi:hypothetical protein
MRALSMHRSPVMRLSAVFVLVPAVMLSACTWVPMEPQGRGVQVVAAGAIPAGCQKARSVVSVKSKVGFYNRNPLRCRKSWKPWPATRPQCRPTPCRPLDQPYDGSQRFAALECPRR